MKNNLSKIFALAIFLVAFNSQSKLIAQTGQALHLDGVNDYIETNANITELGQGDFTIEAWIKTTATDQGIVTCSDNNGIWEIGEKSFFINSLGQPWFVGFSNSYIRSNVSVNNGAWHHVAAVWDWTGGTSGVGKIYIDGVDCTNNSTYIANNNNYGTFKIGSPNYFSGEAPNFFNGTIDEVRIWNYPRTFCDINIYKDIYLSSSGSPLANYHFDNGSAGGNNTGLTNLTDGSGNFTNGTLTNFALTGTLSNWVAPGAVLSTQINAINLTQSPATLCVGSSPVTVTNTATGALSYTWSTGNQTAVQTQTLNDANSFVALSLVGTITGTCTFGTWVYYVGNPNPTVTIVPSSNPLCSGETVTLTASGATSYTWSNGGSNSTSITVTPGGAFNRTLTGVDAIGCTDSGTIHVTIAALPTVAIVPSSTVICSANTVTLNASGASTYTWSNGLGNSASVVTGPNSNFTRTVTGTAVNGCTDQAVQTISVNTSPTVSITTTSTVLCSGKSVTLTASGANTYTWTGGPLTAGYADSPAATTIYTVTGKTTSTSCTDLATISISVNASPTINIATTSTVLCSGKSATLTASNANTYTWTAGPSTATNPVSPNVTTIYTVTGTSAAGGCTDNAVQSISVNASPTINIATSSTVLCSGKTATLTASNANTYTWTSGPLTSTNAVSPNVTTIYTVTGTSAAGGCTDNAVQSISVNASPTINIASTSTVLCSGKTATLTASNANTYTWTAGPATSTNPVSPNVTTIYTVTGTSATGGCTDNAVQSISVNASPTINIVTTSTVLCSGKSATFTASNANTYTWTSGPLTSTNAVSPNVTTIYTVTGTSAAGGCTDNAVQSISVNASPTINIATTSTVLCSGKSATLTASNANTYTWTAGPATSTNPVSPNVTTIYTVTGTSAAGGCTDNAVQSIFVNASPTINIATSSTVLCSGKTATLTASNANTYTWTAGPATSTNPVSPNVTTIYTVTGTSAAGGCTDNAVQSISVNASPTINITSTGTVLCSGNSATLTASNANTYTWTGGPLNASNTVSPNVTTIYTVTGTSATGGCTDTAVQSISVNATPTINISLTSTVICSGKSATLTASNANTYTWTSGPVSSTYSVAPNVTTIYTVTGTGAAGGCTNTAVQSVSVNASPTINIATTNTVLCSGKSATLTANNANTYTWTAGPSTFTNPVSPNVTTIYTVTGTSATGGCTDTAVQSISVNASPTISIATSSTAVCPGVSATLTASNANTYTWTGGPLTATNVVTPLVTTIYTVTGTSATGACTNTAIQSISINATPNISISISNSTVCIGNAVTFTASGANTYSWTGGPVNPIYTFTPGSTAAYTVVGTNVASGCTNVAVQTITVNSNPTITVNSGTLCSGTNFTLSPSGAASYVITGGSAIVSPTINTTYSVTGTSSLGCVSASAAISNLTVFTSPTVSANSGTLCSGKNFTISPSGSSSYVITGGSAIVNPSITTSYSVTGTSTAGCVSVNTAVATVSVFVSPTVSAISGSFCSGSNFVIQQNGASTYTITGGTTTVSPISNTSYSVTGTSTAGCVSVNTAVATVSVYTTPTVSALSGTICSGNSFAINPGGASSYVITGGTATVSPTTTTSYSVTGTSTAGCVSGNTAVATVSVFTSPTVAVNSGSICSGNSFVIVPTGAFTYSIAGGTATVSPTSSANYSVVGYSSVGCISSNTATSSVNVFATPTISSNSGTICAGKSFTLVPTGASSYTISGGTFTVSPIATTAYSISGTTSAGCAGTATFVSNVVVNSNPTVSVNSPSICLGNTATLIASGANTYSWSNGGSQATITLSPSSTNNYSVVGTNTQNCSSTVTTSIIVYALPTLGISGNTVICNGSSLNLSGSGANTYSWNNGSQLQNISVNPIQTSTYILSGTVSATGCSSNAVHVVSVNPTPTLSVTGSTFICAGSSHVYSVTGANTYTWSNSVVNSSVSLSPTITSIPFVTGTNTYNCSSTQTFQIKTTSLITPSLCMVTVDSVSVNNEIYWDKSLFPRADTFIVYRENSASIYTQIARIARSAPSFYADTNRALGPNNGNPNNSAYKYKLQYKDSCGNLSAMSPYHKTIFNIDFKTGSFTWNYYNIEGIGDVQGLNYELWRQNVITGALTFVNGTSNNAMTDQQYSNLAAAGNVKWFVTYSLTTCDPDAGNSVKHAAKTKTGTKSNQTNERQFPTATGLSKNSISSPKINLFPNPAESYIYVDLNFPSGSVRAEVSDVSARVLLEKDLTSGIEKIDVKNFSNGIYFLRFYIDDRLIESKKFIVQHP